MSNFFVVAAPGFYGDKTRVVSSHATIDAAKKAARGNYVVRLGGLKKGNTFFRSSEQIYSIAQ